MKIEAAFPAPGLVVWQPERSYRYGVEVYLLAHFALCGGEAQHIVEFGGGSGVISLLLAATGASVTMVELQPEWLRLARRSVADSGEAGQRVHLVEGDIRFWEGKADLVVCNPPWFPADQPRSPDALRAASRSMLSGEVHDFVEAGLRVAPRVCVVTRPEREKGLRAPVRRALFGERLVLLEFRREGGATQEEGIEVAGAYARWGMRK